MIILEGPDGSGKTSLAKSLLVRFPELELMPKAVNSNAGSVTDVRKWVERSIDRGFGPYLYDRHALISEFIYGPAWKGFLREGFDDRAWIAVQSARLQLIVRPLVIICLPPIGEVVKNIRKDPFNEKLYPVTEHTRDDARPPKSIGQIYWAYFGLSAMRLDYAFYDYTVPDGIEVLYQYIGDQLKERLGG